MPGSSLRKSQAISWLRYRGGSVDPEQLEAGQKGGYKALDAMEAHLSGKKFLVGEPHTSADISLYAYTQLTPEGGFGRKSFHYAPFQAYPLP